MSPAEFPEPPRTYYVMETFSLAGGGRLTDFAAGPFDDPDTARRVRDSIRAREPGRCVHCVECVNYDREGA